MAFKPFSLSEAINGAQTANFNRLKLQSLEQGMQRKRELRQMASDSVVPTYGRAEGPPTQQGEAPQIQTGEQYSPEAHRELAGEAGETELYGQLTKQIGEMDEQKREALAIKNQQIGQALTTVKDQGSLDVAIDSLMNQGVISEEEVQQSGLAEFNPQAIQMAINRNRKVEDILNPKGSGGGAAPYTTFIPSEHGIIRGNARTGEMTHPDGSPFKGGLKGSDSPEIKRQKKRAVLEEELKLKADIEEKVQKQKFNEAMKNPNSPIYKKTNKEHSIDLKKLKTSQLGADQAIKKVEAILDEKSSDAFNMNFGGYNAAISQFIPGDDTQNMRTKINSLKSDLKKAGLEMMRAGGSIGQMTQAEWPIVEQVIETITPLMGEDAAREAFKNIKNYLTQINENAKYIYQDRWEDSQFYKGERSDIKEKEKEGIKPDDLEPAIWDAMTPEERALFQ